MRFRAVSYHVALIRIALVRSDFELFGRTFRHELDSAGAKVPPPFSSYPCSIYITLAQSSVDPSHSFRVDNLQSVCSQ